MRTPTRFALSLPALVCIAFGLFAARLAPAAPPTGGGAMATLGAGAAAVDTTPTKFPVIINGGFIEAKADRAFDALHARAIVLADGRTRLAIAVADVCGIDAGIADEAKRLAHDATGIPVNRILISATHTHSAPSVWPVLGSRVDAAYAEFLTRQLARVIAEAAARVQPCRVGSAVVAAPDETHCRRWIFRSDKIQTDPFGQHTVRANMHPGYQSPNVIGPAGPVDPDLTLLAIQNRDGVPLAVLANFSQHYFGAQAVSADYAGRFAEQLSARIGQNQTATEKPAPPVCIFAQGTSGDQMWMDYGRPKSSITLNQYADHLAEVVMKAYGNIQYRDRLELAMTERTLRLRRRVPDAERLAWAQAIIKKMGSRTIPATIQEVYAQEAIHLHDVPEVDIKLQAIRIGELGIAAWPDEVFAISGLKLKAQSPLPTTLNIELANGAFGYIPPPEQHRLGGYTTWPARSAGLEEQAEPKIVEALLSMLEEISGKPRRKMVDPVSAYARAVLAAMPAAYWRLGDITSPEARDAV
ncbi:MAG: hypothetical protein K8T25_12755, partial [Planctomycetia bacterium]|nr:hypothetical protein [Planctomycetia bacterium]